MIILKTNSKIISVKTVYFAQKPSLKKCFFSTYRSTGSNKHYFFFKRSSINTLINNLNVAEVDLFKSFKKQTKYEINRSIRDNLIKIDLEATLDDFLPLYNRFATKRGWRNFKVREEMLSNLHVTACRQNDKVIISHLYFLDYNSKRVCLEATVSDLCCTDDIHYKALLGRSNRHLHYTDMLYFKSQGFESYDFGGYDNYHINDKKKLGINKFKESFRGVLAFESNYTSYPLLVLFKIKKIARFFRNL